MSRAGVVDDDALGTLAAVVDGDVHVRLVVGQVGSICRCCVGEPADIVAVIPEDPSLPDGLGRALLDSGVGVAVATQAADHFVGSSLITETASFPIVRAGIGGDAAVVIRFSDSVTFLSGRPNLISVAVFNGRSDSEVPEGWVAALPARDPSDGRARAGAKSVQMDA